VWIFGSVFLSLACYRADGRAIEHEQYASGIRRPPGKPPKMYTVRGTKRKKISTVDIPGNIPQLKATYAVKSPYENRLLIITRVSSEHIEFGYMVYTFYYNGCHPTAGF
jgi:hypothetical protein